MRTAGISETGVVITEVGGQAGSLPAFRAPAQLAFIVVIAASLVTLAVRQDTFDRRSRS